MNIVELLMVEHASLRVHLRFIRGGQTDSIYEVEDFVRNCHGRIEDEIVFPKMKEFLLATNNEPLVKTLSRLEADHRLLEKIGDQIKERTVEGNLEIARKRIMLYADTLESHNASEESLVFPFWSFRNSRESSEIASMAMKAIDAFGRDRYFRITGISEKLFDSLI